MPRFPVEYLLCQIQSGQISLALRSHRREARNPEIDISVNATNVRIQLHNLFDGVPQAVLGDARQTHVDIYYLQDELRTQRTSWPTVAVPPNPNLLLPTFDPSGTERAGGRRVRMVAPMCRLGITEVNMESTRAPAFRAEALSPDLFVDFEVTPVRGYGQETPEIHIGCNGEFNFVPTTGAGADICELLLTHEMYSTLLDQILRV